MAEVIYGSEISKQIKEELKEKVRNLVNDGKRAPHLVVILVGEDVGSLSYVRGKEKACDLVGIKNTTYHYQDGITEKALIDKVHELNEDDGVDGILVQLPLPKHIDANKVLIEIDPNKDVDGFHPYNIGRLMLGQKTIVACTPRGIMKMLEVMGFNDMSGLNAVVIGRSNIVGKPVAQLLLQKNATVTTCHSRTGNIQEITRNADILVAAVGQPKIVKADWVKEGVSIIDVGVNRGENGKLCGDVDFDDVFDKAKNITPVPKGVGPMTIAMLLENTYEAYLSKPEIQI